MSRSEAGPRNLLRGQRLRTRAACAQDRVLHLHRTRRSGGNVFEIFQVSSLRPAAEAEEGMTVLAGRSSSDYDAQHGGAGSRCAVTHDLSRRPYSDTATLPPPGAYTAVVSVVNDQDLCLTKAWLCWQVLNTILKTGCAGRFGTRCCRTCGASRAPRPSK